MSYIANLQDGPNNTILINQMVDIVVTMSDIKSPQAKSHIIPRGPRAGEATRDPVSNKIEIV
jgi:hypothetical protein